MLISLEFRPLELLVDNSFYHKMANTKFKTFKKKASLLMKKLQNVVIYNEVLNMLKGNVGF